MNKNFKIHFIITGGTIDSRYDANKCTVVPFRHSVIPEYLKRVVCVEQGKVEFSELCMKDSRDLSEKDIKKILYTIEESPHNRFIVTQGTYTLFNTASYLKSNLENENDITVILTGSMIPLQGFLPSDAGFNLGFALSEARNSLPGVYVCFHGEKFNPEDNLKLHAQ
jgi:L-asparaginase